MRRVALVSSALVAGAARVVDRTLACTTGVQGGARVIYLRAQSAFGRRDGLPRGSHSGLLSPRGGLYVIDARAHSGTRLQGNFGGATGNPLAWMTSGKLTATMTIDQDFEAFDVKTFGTIGVRRDAPGLPGGAAGALGDEYECAAPRQVVVRFRALLAATGRLKRGDDFLTVHVPVLKATLAVRTLSGKPLVYVEVGASGKAKLFAGRGCTAD